MSVASRPLKRTHCRPSGHEWEDHDLAIRIRGLPALPPAKITAHPPVAEDAHSLRMLAEVACAQESGPWFMGEGGAAQVLESETVKEAFTQEDLLLAAHMGEAVPLSFGPLHFPAPASRRRCDAFDVPL